MSTTKIFHEPKVPENQQHTFSISVTLTLNWICVHERLTIKALNLCTQRMCRQRRILPQLPVMLPWGQDSNIFAYTIEFPSLLWLLTKISDQSSATGSAKQIKDIIFQFRCFDHELWLHDLQFMCITRRHFAAKLHAIGTTIAKRPSLINLFR